MGLRTKSNTVKTIKCMEETIMSEVTIIWLTEIPTKSEETRTAGNRNHIRGCRNRVDGDGNIIVRRGGRGSRAAKIEVEAAIRLRFGQAFGNRNLQFYQ